MQENVDPNKSYEVEISMLEIYNERITDLLVTPSIKKDQSLKVKEADIVFIEGLSKHKVSSYKTIEDLTQSGYKNRSIGATKMNK